MPVATVEFLIDVVSPNAYLAWHGLKPVLARTGAQLELTPVFLGGMHKLTGNAPPMIRDADVRGKNEYAMLEMQRFIADHGLTRFNMNPHFPMNTLAAQRALLVAQAQGRDAALAEALLAATWEDGRDISEPAVLADVLRQQNFDPEQMQAATGQADIKARLIGNTEQAVARGAFGVPTFFIGEEMFFGKERLGQMESMLAALPRTD
jgi:2-hydroxychromene-2-carboxylate isomerase